MKHLLEYHSYSLNEGGKALPGVRRVTQQEARETIANMEKELFPLLGLTLNHNAIVIGSATHKPEGETSGDIDIGTQVSLSKIDATVKSSGIVSGENWMQGLQVLSVSYPIGGNKENGYVQVDFIPIKDKKWAEFIYRYPTGSAYKSAVRNWLLAAICASVKEHVEYGEDGTTPISWDGLMLKLNDGLFDIHKTFLGTKRQQLLKQGQIAYEGLVTIDPVELVHILFGDEIKPENVETFEDCFAIIKSEKFIHKDTLDQIIKEFKRFLTRAKLDIPKEIE